MPLSLAPERRECFAQRRRASLAAASCCWITAKAGAKNSDVRRRPLQLTNMYVEPAAYLSQNPHFANLPARYTQWDFIELVGKYGIAA